jgi:hypothetical protein
MAIAEFPPTVRATVYELESLISTDPVSLLMPRKSAEQSHWVRRFPAPEDTGYLLLSGIDPKVKHSTVRLIRISDGVVVARWNPDWPAIFEMMTDNKDAPIGSWTHASATHSLLLDDGDIIFGAGTSLVRLNSCSRKPVWLFEGTMHHSIELDSKGTIWGPSISKDGLADNPWLRERIQDDSIAHVSTDGRLIDKTSFIRILRDNGLEALVLGQFGPSVNVDPIHMNQIQIAPRDSRYWRRGDLLISARHLSAVFLYRPSTRRIIWHQTGPWMNQHSVDFVDDHRISVFSNNVVSATPKEHAFLALGDINRVFLYDFDTRQVSQPFATLLADARPVTITQGRARVLPDGGLFVEETNNGRHLRFTRDRLLWSRVNDYDDQRIGMVSWSRYLTADEARLPLQALADLQCPDRLLTDK